MLKTLALEQKSTRLEALYIKDFGLFQLTLNNTGLGPLLLDADVSQIGGALQRSASEVVETLKQELREVLTLAKMVTQVTTHMTEARS